MKAQSRNAESDFRTALYVCQHGKPYYHHYNGSGLARYGYRLGQLAVEHAAVGSGDDDKAWASIVLTKKHSYVWELTHGSAKPGDWLLIWQYFKYFHKQAEWPDQGLIIEQQYPHRNAGSDNDSDNDSDKRHLTHILNQAQALRVAKHFSVAHWGRVMRVVDNNTGEVLGEYQYGENILFAGDHYPHTIHITDTVWIYWTRVDEAVLYKAGIPVSALSNRRPHGLFGRWIWDAKYIKEVTALANQVDPMWGWSRVTPRNIAHAKFARLVQEVAAAESGGGQR